jgi:hypothetical protein
MPNPRQIDKRNPALQSKSWLWLRIRWLRLRGQADAGAIASLLEKGDRCCLDLAIALR